MKNQSTITREECKKGILSGGVLAAMGPLFALYVSENREIPFLHQYVRGDALPAIRVMGMILFFVGICIMLRNKRRLNALEGTGGNSGAGNPKNPGGGNYAYYYCEHCGKKLRITGGKGRLQITCPLCGHSFIVKR